MVEPVRVLLVEDDAPTRENLQHLIDSIPGFVCISARASFAAGREAVLGGGHDLVMIDIGLGDGSGLELIRLTKTHTSSKALVITVFADQANVLAATEAGVDGYLLKDADQETIQRAMGEVMAGAAPLSPSVAAHLLRKLQKAEAPLKEDERVGRLTPREMDVLDQLARGHTYREVGQQCGITHNTVAFHVKQIYDKLQVNSRGEAIYKAVNDGLISMR